MDLPLYERKLVENFGGDLGNELSEVTVNVTNIDFPGERKFTVRDVMFNITVMRFCDLSNLSGLVILLRRMTRENWICWGSIEVLSSEV